jgi:hypothetical protein
MQQVFSQDNGDVAQRFTGFAGERLSDRQMTVLSHLIHRRDLQMHGFVYARPNDASFPQAALAAAGKLLLATEALVKEEEKRTAVEPGSPAFLRQEGVIAMALCEVRCAQSEVARSFYALKALDTLREETGQSSVLV